MKHLIKIATRFLVTAIILIILFFPIRIHLLSPLLEYHLQSLSTKLTNTLYQPLIISNTKSDGSETLTEDLPENLRVNTMFILNIVKIFSGPESRIFIYIDQKSDMIKVHSMKKWRSSTLYFGDIKILYATNKENIKHLLLKNKTLKESSKNMLYYN